MSRTGEKSLIGCETILQLREPITQGNAFITRAITFLLDVGGRTFFFFLPLLDTRILFFPWAFAFLDAQTFFDASSIQP